MFFSSVLELVHPISFVRKHVRLPIEAFIDRTVLEYKTRTQNGISSVKELLLKSGVIALFISSILWISIFLYVAFYYTYMPNITHMRPVHLQFKSCDEQPGLCSFPSAHVQLTKRNQMLMAGQPYRIKVVMEMPETYANKELGMFMVCCQLRSKDGSLITSSCRSAMLRHRSRLHELIRTLALAPLYLSGLGEEKQTLLLELFSDFEDDQGSPVTDAYVEVQSRLAQFYSAALHIDAHFTGLRYIMFTFPLTSAVLGIGACLFLVSLVFILSWYHITEGTLPDFVKISKPFKVEKQESTVGEDMSFLDDSVESELKKVL